MEFFPRARVFLVLFVTLYGVQGQVISEPDDVTVCEGREVVFTCVLNSNIGSDDVQWYRFIKDTGATEMVDPVGDNINFITDTIGNTTSSSLTITNVIKSYTGYFWAVTPSLEVCNASLTVLTSPSALTVNVIKNIESSSIVLQWDTVDDSAATIYTITWTRAGGGLQVATLIEQTSYTITGLILDTVYAITVSAANRCGQGPEFFDRGYQFTTVTIISEPDDVTTCEGREAVFTCVLNSNIRSDDVQWYRFIKDTSTTEVVDLNGDNINVVIDTLGNGTSSSLTITNVIKSYTGYFWVGTPSLNVCNASLTVLTRPPYLTVNVMQSIEGSSIAVQWDAVDNSTTTTYAITWSSTRGGLQVATVIDQTSYSITGLTLDIVYTITVSAVNRCGQGPEFSTRIQIITDTTMKFSRLTYRVNEDGGSVQPALVLSRPVSANTTVTVLSGDGSAEGGVDYVSGPFNVIIPAGQTTASFDIPIIDDNIYEQTETFMLNIDQSSLPDRIAISYPRNSTVFIKDDGDCIPCNITRNVTVRGKEAIVTFSYINPKTTLTCKLNQKKFETCTSPTIYQNLTRGRHRIVVKAKCPCQTGEDKKRFRFRIR